MSPASHRVFHNDSSQFPIIRIMSVLFRYTSQRHDYPRKQAERPLTELLKEVVPESGRSHFRDRRSDRSNLIDLTNLGLDFTIRV